MSADKEIRTLQTELRVKDTGEKKVLAGYAAVFNVKEEIWGFKEEIIPGAFAETIEKDDVRALFNHNDNYVLGRNKSGTLRLLEDEYGLFFEVERPEAQWAKDLVASIERKDISQCSFAFRVLEETWKTDEETKETVRQLKKVTLWDVGPVTYPAYEQTSVSARAIEHSKELQKEKEEPQAEKHKMAVRQKKLRLIEKTLEQTREV